MTSPPTEREHDTWRRASKASGGAAIAAFAAAALLWAYYGMTRPIAGDPAALGRTWALNYRGRVAFLLDGELALLVALFCVSLVAVIALVAIEILVDPWNRRPGKR